MQWHLVRLKSEVFQRRCEQLQERVAKKKDPVRKKLARGDLAMKTRVGSSQVVGGHASPPK